jgi:outer membrane protein assembly factor BamB
MEVRLMRRRVTALLAALAALPLVAATALAGPFPNEIPLPDGWQPEGIEVGRGFTAYSGSRADGSVARVDLRTGEIDEDFIEGQGAPAVGIEYEEGADRLWVAGGPSGEVRVYDASTGEVLEIYSFGAGRFVNDIVVIQDAAYATDSLSAELLVVPLGSGGDLPAAGDTEVLPLGGDWVQVAGFNANGIEEFAGWLIVPNSTTGQLVAVDPDTGEAVELLPAGSVTRADGILFKGSKLYVVQNLANTISVWRFAGGEVRFDEAITQEDVPGRLDVPTTIAFAGGSLWTVNARFTTPAEASTPYWITRIPLQG